MVLELIPVHSNVKSFGGKAIVETFEDGRVNLLSYYTLVATIEDGRAIVFGTYSSTTLRHIKEFLLQNGFKATSKKQIENDYMT